MGLMSNYNEGCHIYFFLLQLLCVSEMIVRIAKRKLRTLLQDSKWRWSLANFVPCTSRDPLSPTAPIHKISEAIAHFLNCLLGETDLEMDEVGAQKQMLVWPLYLGLWTSPASITTHCCHPNGQPRKKPKKKKGTRGLNPTGKSRCFLLTV